MKEKSLLTAAATEDGGTPLDARILDVLDTLTESERRLADTVLESISNLPSFTASELAKRANVSNATAARFFRRLGYASYADFRKQARREQDWGSPLYELTGTGEKRLAPGDFGLHIAQDLQNLTRTAETLRPEAIAEAIALLTGAVTVWTVGFRNSYLLAAYARSLLINLKPDVRLLPTTGMSLAEDLVGLDARDVVLAIGLRRRPLVLTEIMAVAQERGARSILISDPSVGRTARLATVSLRCHSRGHSLFDSYAAAISLINYLCAGVGTAPEGHPIDRLAKIEALHDRLDPAFAPNPRRRTEK